MSQHCTEFGSIKIKSPITNYVLLIVIIFSILFVYLMT